MNAKKLLSTLLSAAMAVSMLAGCFGGGGNKNYSDEAADAANAAQSTVVFSTDATLAKSLQDALADGLTQLDEIDDAMEADENLKPLLTSGWDLDIFAAQGEDAEAAAKTIAEQYIVSAVIGKKAEGKIAMVLHDGNGYYYVAVLTYGNGGSGSGGGAGGNRPGPGDDDDEENGVYDVDAKALDGNGTVKADKTTVKAGETVTITVTPKDGYQIDKIVHEGGTFNYVRTESGSLVYTMSNVTGDVKFHVTFKEAAPDASTVTFTVTGEGTVTNTATNKEIKDGGTLEMIPAGKMTFKVNPDQYYEAVVTGVSCDVTNNGNDTYTLSNVTDGATVTVTFEEIVYKVSPSRILNGRVVVNPSVVYPSRGEDSVTITLHPNVGYELGSIEDIEVSVGNVVAKPGTDNQYIWSGITEDATVDVEFKKSEYTVNVYGNGWIYGTVTVGGSKITNNSDHPVKSGEDFTFTVKANPTGEVASVKVDSVDVTKQLDADGSYTIKDVTANHTVEVNFAAKTYTVDLTADENGKVFPTYGSATVAHGNDFFFTAEPDSNYEIDKVTVTDSKGNKVEYEDIGNGDYIVRDVKDNLTVSVTFRAKTYTVTVTVNEGKANGSITGVPAGGSVAYGDDVSITLDPDTTYKISGLKVDGEDISVKAGESYTAKFDDVSGNHTIEVSFVKCDLDHIEVSGEYKDKYTEGEDFNPDGMTVTAVYEDDSKETVDLADCTFTPSENLQVENNKVVVSYEGKTADVDITVSPATYNINLTINGSGEVKVGNNTYTKSGTISVNPGQTATLNITAGDGYKIAEVKVDGTSQGAANTVTFSNVNDDHTVEVTFEALKKYTVTVEKDKNSTGDGTVNKLGINTVTEGGTFTFTAKPNDNKTTVKVTVDGDELAPTSSTANGNTYTISNINENKKVIVTFAKKTHDVIVHINEQNGTGTVQYRINDGDLYTISGNNKPFYVGDGDKLTIIISPHSNNTFTVDGATPTGNQIVIEKVTDDVNITITFTKKPVTVTGISIVGNTDSFQKYYWCTEDLDLDGLKIEVTYSDTTSETLTVTDGKIDGKDVTYTFSSSKWDRWHTGKHEDDKRRTGWYEVEFKITTYDGASAPVSAPKNLTVYVRCNPKHDAWEDGKCDYAKNWRGTSIAPKSVSTYSTDSAQEHK